MAYVGDLLLSARELMTDLPQSIGAPGVVSAVGVTATGGNFPPTVTLVLVATFITRWGETTASIEQVVPITGAQNAAQVTLSSIPPEVIAVRVYYSSGSTGTEAQYQQFPVSASAGPSSVVLTGSFSVTSLASATMLAAPPTRSSAYLPDTDGQAVSASAIYRWLNQSLAWAASKNRGGLPDFGAVGTTNGQPNYVLPGYWRKIDSAWFDGYPLGLLSKNNVYRRNPVPGYSGMLIVFQATDRLMVEAWPQPNRTSNISTLAAPIGVTDTVANLTSTAGYVLGFGMTQIGVEIVNYAAINGNQLTGLTRGMCGTVPTAQIAGTPTTELNLMIAGYRVPSSYSIGQSANTLYLPPGWDEALTKYLLYRFRKAEQDEQGAAASLKEAESLLSDLSANRIIAGPRQIQPYAAIGPEVGKGLGTAFGGVLIP